MWSMYETLPSYNFISILDNERKIFGTAGSLSQEQKAQVIIARLANAQN